MGGEGNYIPIALLHLRLRFSSNSPTGNYFVVRGCSVALTHLWTDVSRSRFSAFANSASTLLTVSNV